MISVSCRNLQIRHARTELIGTVMAYINLVESQRGRTESIYKARLQHVTVHVKEQIAQDRIRTERTNLCPDTHACTLRTTNAGAGKHGTRCTPGRGQVERSPAATAEVYVCA